MDRIAVAEARLATALEALEGLAGAAPEGAQMVERLQAENQALAAALDTARSDIEAYEARLADLARPGAAAGDADIRLAEMEALAEEAFAERDLARSEKARAAAEVTAIKGRLAALEAQYSQRQADLFRLESVTETAARKLDQSVARIDRAIAE